MSNKLERFVNENREAFDDKMPDPAVLQRLQQQMKGAGKKKGIVISFNAIRWAAACIVVIAGVGIFFLLQKENTTGNAVPGNTQLAHQHTPLQPGQKLPVTKEENSVIQPQEQNMVHQAASHHNNAEAELNERRQILFAKLNDMASPGARVTAAAEAYKLQGADREIVDALVGTMNSDPNTNVRLAALDGLTRFKRESYVKQQLVKSLKKQTDPMVQVQLIQVLTQMKETSILDQLEKMVKDDNTQEAVKDNAYSSILTLKS